PPSNSDIRAARPRLWRRPTRQRRKKTRLGACALASVQKRQALEQMHVLFILQQGAVQGRDQLCRVACPQHLGGNVLDEQELDPVEQLRSRRFFLQSKNLADFKKDR